MFELVQIIILVICVILSLIVKNPVYICVILFVGLTLSVILSILCHRKTEKKIDRLIKYLMMVQDKVELPELCEATEGNIGILQSEIYKVVNILKQSYSNEVSERRYLVDMMSDISHQIKTPLTAITVMTDLLEQPELTDEKRLEYVSKIDKQVNKITWLVKNILILSQLEANVIELKKEKVLASQIANHISDTFEIFAEVKEVELKIHIPAESIEIICDRHWTIEAISNIVKNCIEHTHPGGRVIIRIEQDNIATHIHIIDNGEGIDERHIPHLFQRFYKADNSDNDSVGIGLAMARQIIILQEGKISVASQKGKGSEFYIKMYR